MLSCISGTLISNIYCKTGIGKVRYQGDFFRGLIAEEIILLWTKSTESEKDTRHILFDA